jgi:hypothetical protein
MKCANCNITFSTKRELIEHMLDVHNSPFIEGDIASFSDKILDKRIKDNTHPKKSQSESQWAKVKQARGDD